MDKKDPTSVGGMDAEEVATLLIRNHGGRALVVATKRATKMVEDGDRGGALEWLRISESVAHKRKKPDPQDPSP